MASQPHQTGETTEKVIKVQILHYRNPEMTEEEYYDYWTKTHAKMAAPWLARNGVLKYAIVSMHIPEQYMTHVCLTINASTTHQRSIATSLLQ